MAGRSPSPAIVATRPANRGLPWAVCADGRAVCSGNCSALSAISEEVRQPLLGQTGEGSVNRDAFIYPTRRKHTIQPADGCDCDTAARHRYRPGEARPPKCWRRFTCSGARVGRILWPVAANCGLLLLPLAGHDKVGRHLPVVGLGNACRPGYFVSHSIGRQKPLSAGRQRAGKNRCWHVFPHRHGRPPSFAISAAAAGAGHRVQSTASIDPGFALASAVVGTSSGFAPLRPRGDHCGGNDRCAFRVVASRRSVDRRRFRPNQRSGGSG